MKQKNIILTVLALLAVTFGLVTTTQTASAHSYQWWCKPRRVMAIVPHKIYEIQPVTPRYKSYRIRTKTLKPGDEVKIQHVASYTWLVTGKGLSNGYFHSNNKPFWVTGGNDWFDNYERSMYYDFNEPKYFPKNVSYHLSWNQYKHLVKMGLYTNKSDHKNFWTKTKNYLKAKHIKKVYD